MPRPSRVCSSASAKRASWQVVGEYKDEGISGAKGREQRPALDAILKDAARREFDQVAVWSVDGNVMKVSGHT